MTNFPTILLLAGGQSSRFWPLGDKNLLSFLGKPLLWHQLRQIQECGFKNVVLVVNNENINLIEKIAAKIEDLKIKIVTQEGRGQGAAILSAKEFLPEKDILVVNANDLFDSLLFQQIIEKTEEDWDVILTGVARDEYFPGGYLIVEGKKITGIIEKPGSDKKPSNLIRIVVDYFRQKELLIKYLKETSTEKDDLYEQAMDKMIRDGVKFGFVEYKNYWGYLKHPWEVLDIMDHFLSEIKNPYIDKTADIAKSAVVQGPVIIGKNVRILENSKVKGPCFIGDNVIIGNNAMVRESIIGENCIIGFSTDMTRSYVGDNSWFHANYVGDSIIADNVSLGSGAVLANLRLDEGEIKSTLAGEKVFTKREKLGAIVGERVRIGVNVSVMPGVKIGRDSFVGAGAVLHQDVQEERLCWTESRVIIKENKFKIDSAQRKKFRKKI